MFIINDNLSTAPLMGLKTNWSTGDEMALAFLPSVYIKVFPCARRRSVVENDADTSIPFDPEARMNTEKNNRNISSNNGTHQSYLSGFTTEYENGALTGVLRFTIKGYNFEISLPATFFDINNNELAINNPVNFFCDQLLAAFREVTGSSGERLYTQTDLNNFNSIYANVLLQAVPLYEGQDDIMDASSVLLRNQDMSDISTALDSLKKNGTRTSYTDYFFSGLTLSVLPSAKQDKLESDSRNAYESISTKSPVPGTFMQEFASLRLFVKNGSTWEINQEALLPEVKHGDIENSIDLGHVRAESLTRNGIAVPSLEVLDKENGFWQLSFKKAVEV